MTKGKRYKETKKRYANFFFFYITVAIIMFTGYTFSRYTTTIKSDQAAISIAKFNVKVNGEYVGNSDPFQIQLSPNANTQNNKIAPDVQGGYFEIIIDPTETEVSLEYEFVFNLDSITQNVRITKYTVNGGPDLAITDNVIKGDILLPSQEKGFEAKDAVNIKAYWEWNEDIVNPTITSNNMSVTSIIKQKLN